MHIIFTGKRKLARAPTQSVTAPISDINITAMSFGDVAEIRSHKSGMSPNDIIDVFIATKGITNYDRAAARASIFNAVIMFNVHDITNFVEVVFINFEFYHYTLNCCL